MIRKQFISSVALVALVALIGCDANSKKEATKSETETTKSASTTETDSADSAETKKEPAENDSAEVAQSNPEETERPDESPAGKPASDSGFDVAVAGDALKFRAPDSWVKKKPRSFVVEYEIAVPKCEGEAEEAKDGRLTIMGAGGSVQANIDRWYGQYVQPDGSETKDVAKVTEEKVGQCEVTFVDITGTLMDSPGGPMAGGKTIERENYRTLAAIIQAGEVGQYFVKLYGPRKTIDENESAFKSFIESMSVNVEKQEL